MPNRFHIFSGEQDVHPLWITTVEGAEAAQSAAEQIAKEKPGKYFVWHVLSNRQVFAIDTTPEHHNKPQDT
jgi:hypothetical protein